MNLRNKRTGISPLMKCVRSLAQKPIIRGAVTLAVLLLVLRSLDLGQVGSLFREFQLSYFVIAVFVGVGANLLAGLAWCMLLAALGVRLPIKDAFLIYTIGLFIAFLTPGGLAGDAIRIHQLHRRTAQGIEGFTSILISRVLSVVTLLLVGAVAGVLILPGLPSSNLAVTLFASSFVGLVVLVLMKWPLRAVATRLPEGRLSRSATQMVDSFNLLLQRPHLLTGASICYIAHHLLVVLSVHLAALTLGLQIPFLWILALVPLGRGLVLLPVSLSGLGVQEAAFVILFAQVGVEASASFSISLLSHLVLMIVPLGGGLVFLLGRRTPAVKKVSAGSNAGRAN